VALIDANSGFSLERTSVVGSLRDPWTLQTLVTQDVARLLEKRLGHGVQLHEQQPATRNADAWLLVQRAELLRKDIEERQRSPAASAVSPREMSARLVPVDSFLRRAELLDPRWPKPILSRAAIALNQALATRDAATRGELIEVGLGHTARALALDAQNAEGLELRGTLHYMKSSFSLARDPTEAATLIRAAEEDLREATRLDPSRASAWNTLSLVLYRKFDRQGAYTAASRAYEEDAYLQSAKDILWRLYATSYDLENFVAASQWCEAGSARYPTDAMFATCRLWLTTTSSLRPPDPEAAWQALEEIRKRTPAGRWDAVRRQYEMLVAIPIARAGNRDSALRVIERNRGGRDFDPSGELMGREVLVRTLIGDKDDALELLASYLAAFPQYREGFAKGNAWWWRTLQDDPRFKALVGA
jgi:hypothetical protein